MHSGGGSVGEAEVPGVDEVESAAVLRARLKVPVWNDFLRLRRVSALHRSQVWWNSLPAAGHSQIVPGERVHALNGLGRGMGPGWRYALPRANLQVKSQMW